MPASFQGTSFFLTYSQDAFDLADDYDGFRNFLDTVGGGDGTTVFLRVGVERHDNGDPHWHALVLFASKRRLGARAFDYRECHPNVQPVGRKKSDWDRVATYVAKDGNYRDAGTPRHAGKSVWSQVAAADSREDALELIRREAPRDYVVNRRNVDYGLDALFPMRPSMLFNPRPLESFCVPGDLSEWVSANFT